MSAVRRRCKKVISKPSGSFARLAPAVWDVTRRHLQVAALHLTSGFIITPVGPESADLCLNKPPAIVFIRRINHLELRAQYNGTSGGGRTVGGGWFHYDCKTLICCEITSPSLSARRPSSPDSLPPPPSSKRTPAAANSPAPRTKQVFYFFLSRVGY